VSKKPTLDGSDPKRHIGTIKENLAQCWMAARLYARLDQAKKSDEYQLLITHVVAEALRAHIVMSMARIWDSGTNNRDCLSFPNLESRNDLQLSPDQNEELNKLKSNPIIQVTKEIRTSFVAHSLDKPKEKAEMPIQVTEIQDLIERCHKLLSNINASQFGEALGWGNFDKELQKWETLIAELEPHRTT